MYRHFQISVLQLEYAKHESCNKRVINEVNYQLLLNDTLYFQAGNFYSSVGSEGFLLCNLCAGMSPVRSVLDLAIQVWRVLLVCYSTCLECCVYFLSADVESVIFNTNFMRYKTIIQSILVYGAEVWQIPTREINKILSTEMDMLRRSARKSRMERIKNEHTKEIME